MTDSYPPNQNPPQGPNPNWTPQGPPPQAPPWQGQPAFQSPPPQQQVPAQSFQPLQPSPKKKNSGLKVAALILSGFMLLAVGGVVGNVIGVGHKVVVTETTPGPIVTQIGPTETVTATVTAIPTTVTSEAGDSPNVTDLKRVWVGMDADDRDSIRSSWKQYKDNPTQADAYVQSWIKGMTSMPTLTAAEVTKWLNWTQEH